MSEPDIFDEVPGLTTYIKSENRFREPWEYQSAWKWDSDKIYNEKAAQSKIELLKEQIVDLNIEKAALKHDIADVRRDAKVEETNLNGIIDTQEKTLTVFKDASTQYKEWVLKYGDHSEDCEWIDFASSGRIIKNKKKVEKEKCSCGFVAATEHTIVK